MELYTNKSYDEIYGKDKSKKIRGKMSVDRSGENSSMWKGGIANEPYPFKFNKELKEKIRIRDKKMCQLCGVAEKDLTIKNRNGKTVPLNLCVHHIDYNKQNCSHSNLISLCRRCNSLVNFNTNKWVSLFREKLS